MEISIRNQNISKIGRQRNLFVLISIISLLCLLLLSFKVATLERQVILVPGISKTMSVTDAGVSPEYLEEVSTMLLALMLDLDHDSMNWKKDRLLEYVSSSDPSYLKGMIEYFANLKEQYNQFQLSTHFATKKYHVDNKKMQVIASGLLVSRFGERGLEKKPVNYLLSFEWVAGKLLLKEFKLLKKEELGEA